MRAIALLALLIACEQDTDQESLDTIEDTGPIKTCEELNPIIPVSDQELTFFLNYETIDPEVTLNIFRCVSYLSANELQESICSSEPVSCEEPSWSFYEDITSATIEPLTMATLFQINISNVGSAAVILVPDPSETTDTVTIEW